MPKLSHDQLQEWYAQLKTTLYEQANIDLTRKEDIGHVRIFRINEWHYEDPSATHDTDMIYPFIPHRPLPPGEKSADPLLSHYYYDPPAPNRSDMETYHKWLLDNLITQPSDELIQELYDMSAESQLFVYDGAATPGLRQIQNNNGEIVITDTFDNIKTEQPPQVVQMPADTKPVMPMRPAKPEAPGDPPKGFWTRVGYYLGIQTEYAKYMGRKKAYDQYTKDLANWKKECDTQMAEWEAQAPNRMQNLEEQTNAFNKYYQDLAKYYMDPLNRFNVAYIGYNRKVTYLSLNVDDTLTEQREAEEDFWSNLHKNSLLGKLQTGLDEASELYGKMQEMGKTVEKMFGPKYKDPIDNVVNGVLGSHKDVTPYAVPVMIDDKISDNHAAWICLAVLADAEFLSQELATDDRLSGLGAQERYQKIVDAFLVNDEYDSEPLFPYVRAARTEGMKAMQEYAIGKPQRLSAILSNAIHRQNKLASYQTDPHALKSYAITASLLEVLDAHPALMEHCKLSPDDLRQARTNAATYQINKAGQQAKAVLLDYALYKKDLSQDALQTAIVDLLFMNTINTQVEKHQDILLTPEKIQQAKQALMQQESVTQLIKQSRTDLGKAAILPPDALGEDGAMEALIAENAPPKNMEQPQLKQPEIAPVPQF